MVLVADLCKVVFTAENFLDNLTILKAGTSLEVVQRIKDKTKEVIVADAIFVRYDAIVIIEAPALENINRIVYKIIEGDPNVTRTETSIVMSPM